jgi:hypothetical protein
LKRETLAKMAGEIERIVGEPVAEDERKAA